MLDTHSLIKQAYAAFNARDIDSALALMTVDVRWPKASEGGYVVGKDEIRSYWTRQWKEFDPHVQPLAIREQQDGSTEVRVRQLVKSLGGEVLADDEVWHIYRIAKGLIEQMELREEQAGSNSIPSAAFSRR